jgi:hypothetical protein
MKWIVSALAGIVALTVGSVWAIYRVTELGPPAPVESRRVAPINSPSPAAQDVASVLPVQVSSTPPATELPPAPDVIPGDDPRFPGPVPNEVAPAAGPAPTGVPTDPEEQQAALNAVRKQRFADQMERLNRRNEQRGGRPAPVVAPPPGQPLPHRRGERPTSD